MPCAVALDWLLVPPTVRLELRQLYRLLVLPLSYLAYTLVRGGATGWYPYPFLNPQRVAGYGGVAAYAACITALFLFVGWTVLVVGNRRRTGGGVAR